MASKKTKKAPQKEQGGLPSNAHIAGAGLV